MKRLCGWVIGLLRAPFCANNTRSYIFKESYLPNAINAKGPVMAYIITDGGRLSKLLQGFMGLVGPDEYNITWGRGVLTYFMGRHL